MEITQQISTLQEEMKLLKGEIKSILKEVRTALLTKDNPFSPDAGLPTFRTIGRTGGDAMPDVQATDDQNDATMALEPPPGPAPFEPSAAPPPSAGPAPGSGPAAPPSQFEPSAGGPPAASPEPIPIRPSAGGAGAGRTSQTPEPEPEAPRWTIATVASLAAWAEDSLATLGPKRFQTVLELSTFAGLVTPEVRDVLANMASIAPETKAEDRPMHINECLVVLRQLEAILQGEKPTRIPRRRGGRHSRVR